MRRHAACARTLAGALGVLTALTSAAPPAAASEAAREPAPVAKTSLGAAALRVADQAPRSALAQAANTPPDAADSNAGFLGTNKGKFVAVLFVAGAAWAIYSAHHDRDPVRSPVR